MGLVSAIAALTFYMFYLQFQIGELQDNKRSLIAVDDVLPQFDGGPYIPVDTTVRAAPESTASADRSMPVKASSNLVADNGVARSIGEFISADPMSAPAIVESAPRSIGVYRAVDDETPRPDALAEPRNIGEYLPVRVTGG